MQAAFYFLPYASSFPFCFLPSTGCVMSFVCCHLTYDFCFQVYACLISIFLPPAFICFKHFCFLHYYFHNYCISAFIIASFCLRPFALCILVYSSASCIIEDKILVLFAVCILKPALLLLLVCALYYNMIDFCLFFPVCFFFFSLRSAFCFLLPPYGLMLCFAFFNMVFAFHFMVYAFCKLHSD